MTKININGVERDMTAEEEAQFLQDQKNATADLETRLADKQAKEDLKASAKAKLIAGEKLTEEEANILVGV